MHRKLINFKQKYLIECDNKECGYKIVNETGDPNTDTSSYINQPCPNCGENLLTEEDSRAYNKLMRTVNWINKWFSWLTVFTSPDENGDTVEVHIHKKK
jgi:transcription initiation factor IIE alpha subunit